MFGGCSGFDCAVVSAELFSAAITLGVSLLVAAFSVWQSHKYHQRREKIAADTERKRRWRFQRRLASLGVARGAAIDIRSAGATATLTGQALIDWLQSADDAEQAVIDAAKKVTKAVGTLVDWYDTVEAQPYTHITDPDQRQRLWNISGVAYKAEQILLIGFSR